MSPSPRSSSPLSTPFTAGTHRRVAVLAGLILGIVALALLVPDLGRPATAPQPIPNTATPQPTTSVSANSPTEAATEIPAQAPPLAPISTAITSVSATLTPPAQPTAQPSPTAETISARLPTATSVTIAAPTPASRTGGLQAEVLSTRYTLAGTPTDGCGKFNAQKISRRFDIQVSITNQTGQDLSSDAWGAAAYSGNKTALLCYFEGQGTLPPLIANNSTIVVLTAFVGSGQEVDTLLIGTASGKVTKLCFSDGKQHSCSS